MASTATKRKAPRTGKVARFFARISTADKVLLEEAADIAGQSTAAFVISKAREAAEQLINDRNVIRLDREETRRVVDALLSPAKPPTTAMKKAMKEYRRSVVSDVNPDSPTYRKSAALW